MEYKINKNPKSEIEMIVNFTADEIKVKLEAAAKQISEHVDVKGFRKGMAPLAKVIQEVGEQKVYEQAAEKLVQESYGKILQSEKIEPLTQPRVEFVKLAAGNEFIYKATLFTIPSVEIGDISSVKVKPSKVEVKDEEVQKVIDELKEHSAMEVLEEREAKMGDKVDVNFDVIRDGVPIEGGQGRKYPLIIGKGQMIPGFEEAIVGMKANEEKEIELTFPEKYHNKNLAGKSAMFKLKVNGVFKRELPNEDDNFAALHGQKTFADIKNLIRKNIEDEEKAKQDQRVELEIIDQLIKKSKFGEIPDVLINQEVDRMVEELKQGIGQQGMSFDEYLMHLKKDLPELKIDLVPKALERVKASLLTRAIFLQNDLKVTHDEIHEEIAKYKQMYASQPDLQKQLDDHSFHDRMENVLGNVKVMKFLKDKVKYE